LYDSDESTGISQFNVPAGLTNDRSNAGLTTLAESWENKGGALPSGFALDPSGIAEALFNAKLANGQYLIPTPTNANPYAYGVPNVTLLGKSLLVGDQATASA